MSELQTKINGKGKLMGEAAAAFAIGGAVIGLLFDKIGTGDSSYIGAKSGALVGALVGAGVGASGADIT